MDVAEFEETLSPYLRQPTQETAAQGPGKLRGALELYTGDLLEGFYDDWALRERERLRLLYMKSLYHLMRFYQEQRDYEKSVACGLQILSHDPLREEIHREVMRLYQESGQRAMAIRQYRVCSRILEKELGVSPMEETRLLHKEILKAGKSQVLASTLPNAPLDLTPIARVQDKGGRPNSPDKTEMTGLEQAFRVFSHALHQFEKTGEQLRRALQLLERATISKDPEKTD